MAWDDSGYDIPPPYDPGWDGPLANRNNKPGYDPQHPEGSGDWTFNPSWGGWVWAKNEVTPPAGVDPGNNPPPPPKAPPAAPGPGAVAGGVPAGSPSGTFTPPPYDGLPSWMPQAPTAPGAPSFPEFQKAPAFVEPDYEAALKDPGFRSIVAEGERGLQQSAAARGVLNGGGTLKDITAWGQGIAGQRVGEVRDRAVNNYLLNYQTQYLDPYKYSYQKALDTFNGGLGI